jgi:hypothetical protein
MRYDRRTGVFFWLIRRGRAAPGDIAGCLDVWGYWIIGIDWEKHRRGRLAWFYVHGEWPEGELDHEDLIKHHDWISNLRLATQTQNNANRRTYRNNKSGFKGIYFWAGRWRAMIRLDRRGIHIGMYDTPEEAHAAYCIKARELFGDFANGGT